MKNAMAHRIFHVQLPRWRSARHVTVWPQWPYDDETRSAKPVGDPKFRWPPNAPKEFQPGEVMTQEEVEQLKKKIYSKIWEDRACIILFQVPLFCFLEKTFPEVLRLRTWFDLTGQPGNDAFGN